MSDGARRKDIESFLRPEPIVRQLIPALVIAYGALVPAAVAAQDAPSRSRSVFRPLVGGTAAGLGLAIALINQPGEEWLLSDGSALPLSVAAGLVTAFVVRGRSSGLERADGRRPRLRIAVGGGQGMSWDVSLGYRAPVGERLELEGMVLVVNDTWELIETETRCSDILGCFTGQFLTDYRYGQSVAALARGSYALMPNSAWRPALALGAGPVVLHVEPQDQPATRRTGVLLDGSLAVERGGRSRIIAEVGYRIVASGSAAGAELYRGGWSLRSGLALGY